MVSSEVFHHQPKQRTLEVLSSLSYRTGELNTYLQEVALGVSSLIGLDWSVVTFCRDGYERVLASTVDMGEAAEGAYALHGSLTGTVVSTGSPLVVEDATTCTAYGEAPEGYRAYLGVPLRTPTGEVIGTICSYQHQPRLFTDEEIRLAEIFADRAATAIDNYQLYQQQQQFNEVLEAEVVKRTVELRATQSQLMTLNSQLEQRVEERTAELQQLNQQLQAEVTERKQIETALRMSEEQFRQLAENIEQIFWMYTSDGKPIYVSPTFEKIWGVSSEQWYQNHEIWTDSVHPEDRDRVFAVHHTQLESKQEQEYRIIRSDGSVRLIRDQAFPVRDAIGKIYRIAGIAEDITDRKKAEQDMLKAIESLAEVGELASMIVHEVRNPLSTVMLGLNHFKKLDLPDSAKERLALSLDEANRLLNLLNEILLYAKPQTLDRTSIELNQFLTELLRQVRTLPSVMQRQVEFIPSQAPIHVLADKDKLKQVFINLIDNACEAVSVGDIITLRIQPNLMCHQVFIQVHNAGKPIPPEVLPKLIRPFYTTKTSGTGLGLAIVKRIVEAHDGELKITSSASDGTIVSVCLAI